MRAWHFGRTSLHLTEIESSLNTAVWHISQSLLLLEVVKHAWNFHSLPDSARRVVLQPQAVETGIAMSNA